MTVKQTVNIFKALGDETRLRILHLFVKSGEELCVCELTDALEVTQYNVSRHLKVLAAAGLLSREKAGRWVYFKLNRTPDAVLEPILRAIDRLADATTVRDLAELRQRLALRTDGRCTIGIQKRHLVTKGQGGHRWGKP